MTPFQETASKWLVRRIITSAQLEGREIESLNFKTPLYVDQESYDSGVQDGYIGENGIPTEKFREEFSIHVTMVGRIKQ